MHRTGFAAALCGANVHCMFSSTLETCPLVQMRRVLEAWQQRASFSCATCGAHLGLLRDTISDVSDLGPSGTFVNPHGSIRSITCVRTLAAGSVACLGLPTTEFSWFPHYAWTAMICSCEQHLGWRFTRVSGDGPEEFWGLESGYVVVSSLQQGGQESSEVLASLPSDVYYPSDVDSPSE